MGPWQWCECGSSPYILCRDLAQQTEKVFRSTLRHSRHKTTLLVGGVPMESQFEALDAGNVGVVVGTPGRLCELARLKRLTLSQLRCVSAPRDAGAPG